MGAFAGLIVISREVYHYARVQASETTRKGFKSADFRMRLIHYYP
jgi:hypothetical protein